MTQIRENVIDKSWPTESQIEEAHDFLTPINRKWSCFDMSTCTHPTYAVFYAGPFAVCVCESCGHVIEKGCEHSDGRLTTESVNYMEWNEEMSMLRCSACGLDGT